jgi:hypothetical protein
MVPISAISCWIDINNNSGARLWAFAALQATFLAKAKNMLYGNPQKDRKVK